MGGGVYRIEYRTAFTECVEPPKVWGPGPPAVARNAWKKGRDGKGCRFDAGRKRSGIDP